MPNAININASHQETGLDKVLKGLAIAKDVVGIGAAAAPLFTETKTDYDTALKKQQVDDAKRHAQGIFTPVEYGKSGFAIKSVSPIVSDSPQEQAIAAGISAGPPAPKSPIAAGPGEFVGKLMMPDGTVNDAVVVDVNAQRANDSAEERKLSRELSERNAHQAEEDRKLAREQSERHHQDSEKDKELTRNKPSDANAQAAGFGKRMQQAEGIFSDLSAKGYNRADAGTAANASVPGFITALAPKYGQTPENQQQVQAERNFLNAILRRESGAAISKDEFTSGEKQYFPRVGDSPEVLAQKGANRQQAIESMKVAAGPAWDKTPQVGSGNKFDAAAAAKAELARRRKK